MSTICFDIKRVDENYVCIQHCNSNTFNYEYHLPLSFYPRKRNGKDHWWLNDKKYRYVWILVGLEKRTGIERIFWACNDKIWANSSLRMFKEDWNNRYTNIRFIKLPFEYVKEVKYFKDGTLIPIYETTDLGDKFKLYCPINLNGQHHIYSDHYEEVEPTIDKVVDVDGKKLEFKTRNFKWIPPKMLGE